MVGRVIGEEIRWVSKDHRVLEQKVDRMVSETSRSSLLGVFYFLGETEIKVII